MNPLRAGSYAAAGVSVASFVIGLVFGIRSNTELHALLNRQYDASGAVTNFTQREAVTLELQQRREAGVANAMYVTAALALGVAIVLFIVGRD